MSSNVGLSTPRGSGTSGHVQRNSAFLKKLNHTSAPYPPVSGANGPIDRPFKQRMPDKQIIEHEQRREIEVKVMEERERLEEENERIEEEQKSKKNKTEDEKTVEEKVLDDEEIDERCDALRKKLLAELDEELESGKRKRKIDGRKPKGYQVHELAEAKIEETERLRRAFGLKEDRETGRVLSTRNWAKRE